MSQTQRSPIKSELPLKDASNTQWISRELDYNIQHFNDLFIENLSQSLSAMLVKKPAGSPVKTGEDHLSEICETNQDHKE
jgi:hypothetical protein